MADVKISQLPAATTPLAGTEEIPLVQSGVTKRATVDDIVGAISGVVTSVTGTAPVVSSGGTTPAISMAAATSSVNGYLTSTDWTTFNSKQPAGSYLTNGGALGTPSSGTATNLTGLPLTTGVTGLLPVANGGTGTATPSLVQGTNITITGTWPNQTINASGAAAGDVSGPASSTDNAVARFDGTTGKIIQNSSLQVNDSGEVTVGVWKGTEVGISYGGTGAATASQARGNILPSYTGNAGKVLAVNGTATDVEYISAGGTGTVTSVDVSGGTTGLTTSGGPVTAAGTITLAGTLAVANGGTGQTTAAAAITALTGTQTSGYYLRSNGTNAALAAIQAADVPTLNQNTTGSAGSVVNALTAGTGISFSSGTTYNGSAAITINNSGVAAYPGAGIPNSTGSAWGTSYTTSGTGTVVALATSPTFVTPALGTPASGDFSTGTFTWPTFNQNTTGTAAGLSATLAVGSGGTGATSLTVNNVVLGNGTSPVQLVAPGTAGNVLTSNGTTWSSTAPTAQTYPGAGIAVSTGSAWTTSLTAPSGTIVGTTDTQTLTNKTFTGYTETVYALSGTAIDPANGTIQTKTLGGATTFTESLADGQSVVLMLNPATYATTWPTLTWINTAGSGAAPTLKASAMNVVVLWQVGGTLYGNWVGSA